MFNTSIFIGIILNIYYIRHNYMFRPLMLAIFMLYMNTYQVVIQTICGLFLGVGFLQVQDLVFDKEVCVVWVIIGNHAII